MNKYLMSIERYFSGRETFEVSAENKQDALIVAKNYCMKSGLFSGGNYKIDSIKCEKKIKI